jgi:putative FmdB family regulatory protein
VPIYEYACMECEEHFEELVRSHGQVIVCPACGRANVLKQLSTFAVAGTGTGASSSPSVGSGGGCCGGSCGCG